MSDWSWSMVEISVAALAVWTAFWFLKGFAGSITRYRWRTSELERGARIKAKVDAGNFDQEVYEFLGEFLDVDPYSLAAWREQIKLPGLEGELALGSFRMLAMEKLIEHAESLSAEVEQETEHGRA